MEFNKPFLLLSSGRLESVYKLKALLLKYQNVPATWKQMHK